ncbi:MAG: hypothetical protein HFE51_10840 [Clostridia bacterium]|nr:hypothetical protein [Clostridia bacterium]
MTHSKRFRKNIGESLVEMPTKPVEEPKPLTEEDCKQILLRFYEEISKSLRRVGFENNPTLKESLDAMFRIYDFVFSKGEK